MPRLPKSFQNPLSYVGAGIALVSLCSTLVFFIMDIAGAVSSPYLGIFTYMLLPGVMIFGLLLIPLGAMLERRRMRKTGGAERRFLHIDLNRQTHRNAFLIFVVGTMVLMIISAAGTYQAYNYSESVEFCGEVCHQVMKPEYIAYQHSPHARVRCAECHIGTGADWFVKAKISGSYQVYSVLFNKYSRPIETPVLNLRPARETCEHCHWPEKFSANLEMAKTYFPLDTTAAKPWSIVLQLKIGGGHSELGQVSGIHWHMSTTHKVEYVATDTKRQVIPWIRSTNLATGKARVFRAIETPIPDEQLAQHETRVMDCIDCHNRPAHIYHPPFRTLNDAMAQNRIPATLPNIRAIASNALTQEYQTEAQALGSIESFIREEYRSKAPEVFASRQADIARAVADVRRIYLRNFFPEMRVSWKHYPNNIGHMYNEGCFRCHDNQHATESGEILTNDCNICHKIVAQGPQGAMRSDFNGMPFIHPSDIDGAETKVKCTECHIGE
ncbi:MAG: NapC/NirT family cytochrome c [Ignavibacteriae bacterium]|nr:NapC/NirT family cytochrome c [Ignavibacteriota bacterium]